MKALILALALTMTSLAGVRLAHAQSDAVASAALSDGEIRKVDVAAGKVTIKHGPLQNLDMPGMTMVFRVKEADWLRQMKAGDKIRFTAERVNGLLTVTRYEAAN